MCVCCRGAWEAVHHPHQLSNADCVNVFERAVIHPGVRFEIVFGVSASTWPLYDLDHGRRVIGYEPQDKSIVPPEMLPWNRQSKL
jgi:hypothetical protein